MGVTTRDRKFPMGEILIGTTKCTKYKIPKNLSVCENCSALFVSGCLCWCRRCDCWWTAEPSWMSETSTVTPLCSSVAPVASPRVSGYSCRWDWLDLTLAIFFFFFSCLQLVVCLSLGPQVEWCDTQGLISIYMSLDLESCRGTMLISQPATSISVCRPHPLWLWTVQSCPHTLTDTEEDTGDSGEKWGGYQV